ncbi:Replicative DNA helicase [Acidisarcina polymorpha]|uniref:DNA 5'-3' helicase n=1 Tax=Acidisarcina polymorpha TaxID=2211140 RepID=A0A2Z5FS89_9BACT|nr:DnaB-like helicase C-terminal domain-containing protein [Acidisarcina polymorpha]AXC09640.1 Replicative DNA helicase [Acidisarcina polymorpha]
MNEMVARTEHELLGIILLDNAHFHEAAEGLNSSDFGLSSHREIFCAIASVVESGRVADLTSVAQRLDKIGGLAKVGGFAYLNGLDEGLLLTRRSVANFVDAIKTASLRRQLSRIGGSLVTSAGEPSIDPQEAISLTEEALLELLAKSSAVQNQPITELVPTAMAEIRKDRGRTAALLGLTTGISRLDHLTRGVQPGEVWIVGAGSGAGKTSLEIQMAIANCVAGVPTLLFSIEMTAEQLLRRIFAVISGVPFFRVRDPSLANSSEIADLEQAADEVAKWPLHIEDAAGLTISKIVAKSRLAVRRHGVKLIGVDYVQIVNAPGKDERLRVASISRALTALAKDEAVPVIALSQLARADRSSPNRRPRMSDLRESSQLENDAHVVILLHREIDEKFGKLSTNGELIIAKQRSGETGAFPIVFDKRSLTFREAPQQASA